MEYRKGGRVENSRVSYGGGSGRGGGRGGFPGGMGGGRGRGGLPGGSIMMLPMLLRGGGCGTVILLIVLAVIFLPGLFGGNNNGSNQANPPQGQNQQQGSNDGRNHCEGEIGVDFDLEKNPECRWSVYEHELRNYWETQVEGFKPVQTLQTFTGSIQTACGTGSTEMGPFYCPGDDNIYIDMDYTGKLLNQLGARGGDAAELYIVGHEYGHHIQNLTGDMAKARQMSQQGPKSGQVRLELQADCYAGVFFGNMMNDPEALITGVTQDDLERIVEAAHAVGDDHIQQQSGGRVVPESWTHGSSEMRKRWLDKGLQARDPNVCDTFSTDDI